MGFRLCGELAGGHLSGREPRKSASGVTERWQERPGQQGVSRRFALESSGEPGHALTRTSRDPRLFWGTVSRQEAGTCEKGIDHSEAKQSIRSDRAWPIARTQARGRDSHMVPDVVSLPADKEWFSIMGCLVSQLEHSRLFRSSLICTNSPGCFFVFVACFLFFFCFVFFF